MLSTSQPIGRRAVLFGGAAAAGGGVWASLRWFNTGAEVAAGDLTAPEALEGVRSDALVLVDIRRPDEWAATGVPEGALTLDMRRADFGEALQAVVGDPGTPIALICARGIRSRAMANQLRQDGFTHILDVPEGMLGSGAGPGWLARGLPVTPP